jgi:hypothetical protein
MCAVVEDCVTDLVCFQSEDANVCREPVVSAGTYVTATVFLGGLTIASFDSDARLAYKQAILDVVEGASDVRIDRVTELLSDSSSTRRRNLGTVIGIYVETSIMVASDAISADVQSQLTAALAESGSSSTSNSGGSSNVNSPSFAAAMNGYIATGPTVSSTGVQGNVESVTVESDQDVCSRGGCVTSPTSNGQNANTGGNTTSDGESGGSAGMLLGVFAAVGIVLAVGGYIMKKRGGDGGGARRMRVPSSRRQMIGKKLGQLPTGAVNHHFRHPTRKANVDSSGTAEYVNVVTPSRGHTAPMAGRRVFHKPQVVRHAAV